MTLNIRKALAVSLGLFMVGLVGSILVYFGFAVWDSLTGNMIVFYYLQRGFTRALGDGVLAVLPGLIGLTFTGCWYVVSRFTASVQR